MHRAIVPFVPRRIATILTLTLFGASVLAGPARGDDTPPPIRVLIITGDIYPAHDWKTTAPALAEVLSQGHRIEATITSKPAVDLTDANLARYDVLLLHYLDYSKPGAVPDATWSDANKAAFLRAVRDEGKGLIVVHHASGSFVRPNWAEFEQAVGGWRTRGFHGPAHEFTVKKTAAGADHPIGRGAPASFPHRTDELYQNSLLPPETVVLATAYSDPAKPRGTGKDEAIIWASPFGKGRVFEDLLGHDVAAITDPGNATWLRRGVLWAANKGDIPAEAE